MDFYGQERCASPTSAKAKIIRSLNDQLRKEKRDGHLLVTDGVCRLGRVT